MKSWMERFTGETKEKIDWLRYYRHSDFDKTFSLCDDLIAIGKQKKDPALLGFAHCYAAEIYYMQMNFSEAMKMAQRAIVYLKSSDAPIMAVNCYNLLGCIYMQQYAYEAAIDSFLQGASLAHKIDYKSIEGLIYQHIGNVHIMLKAYQKSLSYLQKADTLFQLCDDGTDFHRLIVSQNHFSMITAWVSLECFTEAKRLLDEVYQSIQTQPGNTSILCDYYLALFDYYEKKRDEETADQYLAKFCCAYEKSENKAIGLLSLTAVAMDLYNKHKTTEIELLQPYIDQAMASDISRRQKIDILMAKYRYLEKKHAASSEILPELLTDYDDYVKETNASKLAIIAEAMRQNDEQQQIEEWVDKANRDELTNLYNRRFLEAMFVKNISIVSQSHDSLAIGMIDIDNFKHYNDTYGHLAGDDILRTIANVFQHYSDQDCVFARFGGDEFLFCCHGLSKDAIEKKMHTVLKEIQKEGIHLSIGICYVKNVAEGIVLDDLQDYADQILYDVKKNRKGTITILDYQSSDKTSNQTSVIM